MDIRRDKGDIAIAFLPTCKISHYNTESEGGKSYNLVEIYVVILKQGEKSHMCSIYEHEQTKMLSGYRNQQSF